MVAPDDTLIPNQTGFEQGSILLFLLFFFSFQLIKAGLKNKIEETINLVNVFWCPV